MVIAEVFLEVGWAGKGFGMADMALMEGGGKERVWTNGCYFV
jgi:hypothetical protein